MVKNISSTLNAKQRLERENQQPINPGMYANDDAMSVDRDPMHGYKMCKEKRPPSMLEPDLNFY